MVSQPVGCWPVQEKQKTNKLLFYFLLLDDRRCFRSLKNSSDEATGCHKETSFYFLVFLVKRVRFPDIFSALFNH